MQPQSFFPQSTIPRRFLAFVFTGFLTATASAETLRLYTSPALGQVLATVLPALKATGVDVAIKGEASSAMGIQMLAEGQADAVFTVRAMTGEDRAIAPDKPFVEVQLATQATAFVVSRDVWESGVRALSKEQIRQIYEQEVTNWKRVGGPDRPIKFYNFERGHGVWEQF